MVKKYLQAKTNRKISMVKGRVTYVACNFDVYQPRILLKNGRSDLAAGFISLKSTLFASLFERVGLFLNFLTVMIFFIVLGDGCLF